MEERLAAIEAQLASVGGRLGELERAALARRRNLSLVVFTGDLDHLLAAFNIATGAAATGLQVSMFFTFWGTAALRRPNAGSAGKGWLEKMMGWMLPKGPGELPVSRFNFAGGGRRMMNHLMQKKGAAPLAELIAMASDLGVKINICTMSMELLGFKKDEFIDYPDLGYCGVAAFLATSMEAGITLFV
jgi:peroxiredoxin family protein